MSWTYGGGPRGAVLTFRGIPDSTMTDALADIWRDNNGSLQSFLGTAVKQDTTANYGITLCADTEAPWGLVVGVEGNPTVGFTVTVLSLGYDRIVTFKKGTTGATLGHTTVLVDGSTGKEFTTTATAGNYLVVSEDEPSGYFDALVR